MRRLFFGLFILALSPSLNLLSAALVAPTKTLMIDTTSPAEGDEAMRDAVEGSLPDYYAGLFMQHYDSLKVKADAESISNLKEQCQKVEEAYERHHQLMMTYLDNLKKGIRVVPPTAQIRKKTEPMIFQVNGIEARQAFKETLSLELLSNAAFLRELRTTIAITFQVVRTRGNGTLRYARFLINAINDQLKRLEGGLSPRSASDESEYALFAPSLSKLSRVDGKDYLRDDLFDSSVAAAGSRVEAAVARRTVFPGPLTDIQVDPLVLNQHEDPAYDMKCAYFTLFNALCYANECEGYLVPDLRQDNFEKFKTLYSRWKALADETVGGTKDGGIKLSQQINIYNHIIAGTGGIDNVAIREAFKKHVILSECITLKRWDKEPLTHVYMRFRQEAQKNEDIVNKNIVEVIEGFRAGNLRYLIDFHSTVGDARWNFAKKETIGHASAVLYKRLSDNSTFAMIADSDIGDTNPRNMIKHFYWEVLSNQNLPQENTHLLDLLDYVQRWNEHYKNKRNGCDSTYRVDFIQKWACCTDGFIAFRQQKVDEVLARLAVVSSLITPVLLVKHIENSFKLLFKSCVEPGTKACSDILVDGYIASVAIIVDYIIGVEKLLAVIEAFNKSVITKELNEATVEEINRLIVGSMLLYQRQFERFKEIINRDLTEVKMIDDELKGYVEKMNKDVIDFTLELKAPESGTEAPSSVAAGAGACGGAGAVAPGAAE